jgi:mRNA-degrading endonuclease RelE of RelBE toxin-antitoxin system
LYGLDQEVSKKIAHNQQDEIDRILYKIEHKETQDLDVRKLKGHEKLYRVRVRDIRIVFSKESGSLNVIFIGRRGDSKYEKF